MTRWLVTGMDRGESTGSVSAGHAMPRSGSRGCTPCSRPGEYGGAQVDDRRLVAEGGEGVPQPRLEGYGTPARVIQAHGLPAPVPGEPALLSTITSRTAPLMQVTYLACPGGTVAKCTPRMTPRRDTEQLACAVCGQYPSDSDSSPARNRSRK